jgi:hypothetical protein
MYIVISKIELSEIQGELKFSDYGYTTDTSLQEEINILYDDSLGSYIEQNKEGLENGTINISSFFSNSVDHVFEARTMVYDSNELDGINITSINQL